MDKQARLTPKELAIIRDKATEAPFSTDYAAFTANKTSGTYLCRQCGLALFRTSMAFFSGCGWPSFDHAIENAVRQVPDSDGLQTEIVCARCCAHLGHVFWGEGFTLNNVRHCVNAQSMEFVANDTLADSQEAIFAGGCFWGVEYLLKQLKGVLFTEVGYTGGECPNPSYDLICGGKSGHVEAVRVIFNPEEISYEALAKYFFEIHDPGQADGQGPDRGAQYQSKIFYFDEQQKEIIEKLIIQLKNKGYAVATQLAKVQIFWPGEMYHQNYYAKVGQLPYCHIYTQRF